MSGNDEVYYGLKEIAAEYEIEYTDLYRLFSEAKFRSAKKRILPHAKQKYTYWTLSGHDKDKLGRYVEEWKSDRKVYGLRQAMALHRLRAKGKTGQASSKSAKRYTPGPRNHDGRCLFAGGGMRCPNPSEDHGIGFQFCEKCWRRIKPKIYSPGRVI